MASSVAALVGPTAAGKSEVATQVALAIDAEIVAVDAFTISRGMDIGTAKPDPSSPVRHHMIDLLDPEQKCTAQWFQRRARAVIDEVRSRGRSALLVGGSGLYFRAVVDPLDFPPTDAAVRAALEQRLPDADAVGAALRMVDPVSAERIDPANTRRMIRALEVHEISGRPFSEWQVAWDRYTSRYDGLVVAGLHVDRATLTRRITERVDTMLAAGWLEEAAALKDRPLSRTASAAIGYAELWDHLDGRLTLAEARERMCARTRRYAVRQQRWFARDPRVRWMSPSEAVAWRPDRAPLQSDR